MEHNLSYLTTKTRYSGFSLPLAIILLVAMSLIGVGLFKKSGTATDLAQGLAFRTTALTSADRGLEQAMTWIRTNPNLLLIDNPAAGYYASYSLPGGGSVDRNVDLTGNLTPNDLTDDVDWKNEGTSGVVKAFYSNVPDASGTTYGYIIQRMCDQPGAFGTPSGTVSCLSIQRTIEDGLSNSSLQYGQYALKARPQIYYRITTKAFGPKGATSYVQAMLLVDF